MYSLVLAYFQTCKCIGVVKHFNKGDTMKKTLLNIINVNVI